jgi:hypothetical protein
MAHARARARKKGDTEMDAGRARTTRLPGADHECFPLSATATKNEKTQMARQRGSVEKKFKKKRPRRSPRL